MKTCFIAHRGYSGKYQQNTEESFLEAVKHGSGGIETDVRFTKDGVGTRSVQTIRRRPRSVRIQRIRMPTS